MKAIVCTAYGPPEVLQLQEIPKPIPKANEVLIKVHAGGVSPSDCAFRKGDPFLVRLIYGLSKPRLSTQGVEFAGEVEAVGKGVTEFVVGDQVFGMSPDTFGAHAEYLCLREDKPLTIKPANVNYAEMAGITDGATTALTFLRDVAKVQAGQRVLINGASGAVGAYGVQLAKYFGANVTGVCSGANADLVKSLGADRVIDYTLTDFTRSGQSYDVIFDAVGKRSFGECKNALTPNGLYLSTVPTWGVFTSVLWTALFGRKKAKFVTAGLMQNRDNLNFIATLVEAGHLKAVIDRTYPMEQVVDAHRYVDTGRKKGNVILAIGTA
jgi:NADPH:quinone reductase-like Zn-dependent oxidoreductase